MFTTPLRLTLMALLFLIPPATARADGMMAPRIRETHSTDLVSSPKQEALLIQRGDRITVVLRTHFARGPEELAWIVPVPAEPQGIHAERDAIFSELESLTVPRFAIVQPGGFHFGCAATGGYSVIPDVIVESTGTAGMFDYSVLKATSASDLVTWLSDNHYKIPPGSEKVFTRYVSQKYHFLAMRLRAADAARPTLAPHPIRYTYTSAAGGMTFPLVISKLSAAPVNEIVLYTLAPTRCCVTNWDNVPFGAVAATRDERQPSGTTYERHVRQLTGTRHTFITEYAALVNPDGLTLHLPRDDDSIGPRVIDPPFAKPEHERSHFLTRLRTTITPEQMDRDITIGPDHTGEIIVPERSVGAAGPRSHFPLAGTALLAAAVASGFVGMARRSRVREGVLVLGIVALISI